MKLLLSMTLVAIEQREERRRFDSDYLLDN